MWRILALALLLTSLRATAATGDILAVEIGSDGWSAYATIEGKSTGGTYNWGFGTNNDPATGTPKVVFTVTSLGYDDTGAATTISRTIYGTKSVRKAYPLNAQADEQVSGGNVTVRFSLSDYIYAKDEAGAGNSGTNVTVSILSGWYTQSGGNNAVTGLTVTNNSTQDYAQVIGAWNTVPFQLVGSTFKLRAGAFHRDGKSGRPVRAVKFTVTDGTTTVTQTATAMTISNDDGDAVPIPEYIVTINTSTLTQGATLTANFIAYPWTGDSTSILDTSTGTAAPTPLHGPITMVLDKTGAYGTTMALVDPSSGSDTGAQTVYDSTVYNAGTAYKFATIAKAAQKIKDYNTTNRSRGDVGAGIIELAGGNHAWMGASLGAVYGTTPATWITVRGATGTVPEDVILTGVSGNTDISDRVKFQNLTITSSDAFGGILATWTDKCVINSTAAQLYGTGVHWVTQCDIPKLTQGLKSFSVGNCAFAMVRGCNLTGMAARVHPYNFIGNFKSGTTPGNPQIIAEINGSSAPVPQSQIVAYNKIYGFDNGASGANGMFKAAEYDAYKAQRGLAVVQNLWERLGTGRGGTMMDIAVQSADTGFHNVLLWNNTQMGERQNVAYNKDTTLRQRKLWSVKNNFFFDTNVKDDTFESNSVAVGAWAFSWGVGFSGNELGGENNDFMNTFPGLRSVQSYFFYSAGTADDVFKVVDWRANDGVNPGTGNGDYTPLSTSPAYNLQYDLLIPYDIDGNARGTTDSAGAISTYSGGANTNPVVTITSPATGSTTTSPVSFVGTATDAEDGEMAGSIVWSSNVDGPLGTGASISAPLTAGAHTITATITDSGSATDTDTISLTITVPSASGTINATRVNATSVRIQ
jgi:hypothetical protein